MKITYIILSFFIGMIMFGCKKHNTSAPIIPAGIYALVDGSPFIANYCAAVRDTGSSLELSICGADTILGKQVSFTILKFNDNTGTYTFPDWFKGPGYPTKNEAMYMYWNVNNGVPMGYVHTFISASGAVTIYKVSADSIQGVFNYTTGDSVFTITKGTFNLHFR